MLEASLDYTLQVDRGKVEDIIAAFISLVPHFKETIMTAALQFFIDKLTFSKFPYFSLNGVVLFY